MVISLIAGLLMGSFYPFVSKAMSGGGAPGPYAVALFFAVGCRALRRSFQLPPDAKAPGWERAGIDDGLHRGATGSWHLWGIVGGMIWCTGAIFNFVASQAHLVGPAVSYSIGQGATMISAAWGVFVWKEFASAPAQSKRLLFWMFLLFLCGLSAIALAPILWTSTNAG